MSGHYRMFAAYNAWANRLVYEAVGRLDEADFRKDLGAFFGSLHGTLNHLLAADRIWMRRFTGAGDAPNRLDAILHEDFAGLAAARATEDARIAGWIDTLDADRLAAEFTYRPITGAGTAVTHALRPALDHLFNHQTHHRGQCHAMLTMVGGPSLSLDLIYFLRTDGTAFLRAAE